MEYGGCTRFWYGGEGGNRNRFETKEECDAVCVEPTGKDVSIFFDYRFFKTVSHLYFQLYNFRDDTLGKNVSTLK